MALKWRKKLLLAKVEQQSGTAQILAAADAILAKDIEITPLALRANRMVSVAVSA